MSTGNKKNKGEKSKNDQPEGLVVDVDHFVSSIEVRQGPINFYVRSRRSLNEGLLILEYSIRISEQSPADASDATTE